MTSRKPTEERGMPATMHDVAKLAGVSIKTVSNVLSGYPYVRDTTRAKVLAAVDELGYRMNISARNLRAGRTGIVALAVPELSLPYFAELADAVIRSAEEKSWTVLVEQTGAVRERELAVLSGSRKHLVDGLIFAPQAVGADDIDHLRGDFPIVMIGERVFEGPVDNVAMSNHEAARAATRHLLELGRWADGGGVVAEDNARSLLDDPASIATAELWTDLIINEHIAPVPPGKATQAAAAVSVDMHLNADASDAERQAANAFTNRVTEFVDQPARALHRPVCRARRRRGDRGRPSLRAGLLHADARGIRRAVPVPDGRYWAEARTRARSRRPSQELSLAKVVLR